MDIDPIRPEYMLSRFNLHNVLPATQWITIFVISNTRPHSFAYAKNFETGQIAFLAAACISVA